MYAYLLDETKTGADAITLCSKNADGEWVKEASAANNPQVVTNDVIESVCSSWRIICSELTLQSSVLKFIH